MSSARDCLLALISPAALIVVEATDFDSPDNQTGATMLAPVAVALAGQSCLIALFQSRVVALIADHPDVDAKHRRRRRQVQARIVGTYACRPEASGFDSRAVARRNCTGIPAGGRRASALWRGRRGNSGGAAPRGDRPRRWSDDRELRAYQILADERNEGRVRSFVDDVLGRLAAYDARHQGALVATLEAYLDHNGNLGATSTALFIHLSTLKYRLARIAEIGGVSIHDPHDRFHAQSPCGSVASFC